MDQETEQLLQEAAQEIERLRRVNEILEAKVSTMDLLATILFTNPAFSGKPMGVDIVHQIAKKIAENKKSE